MRRGRGAGWMLVPLGLTLQGCGPQAPPAEGTGEGGAEWLSGTVDERFQAVGDQMGGFSQTMFEVGVRFEHLYWAVQDDNPAYADYQAEKIGDAIERGIERRPGRALSARALFLDEALPAFRRALEAGEDVEAAVTELIRACNVCHVAEDMGHVRVGPPPVRSIPVLPPDPSG